MGYEVLAFSAGVIIAFAATGAFRFFLFRCKRFKKEKKGPRCPVLVWPLLALSPDFFFAYKAKKIIDANYPTEESLKEQKRIKESESSEKAKAKYIKCANKGNLILSFVLCVATFVVVYSAWGKCLRWGAFGFLGYRLLSRTVEINVAFFKDCLDKKKDSDLDKYGRIKLAFKSLLEEAFLFAALYSFAKLEWWGALLGGAHSFILTLFSADFYYYKTFLFVAVYQVICTIVLLTVSFATYISTPDNTGNESAVGGDGNCDRDSGSNGGCPKRRSEGKSESSRASDSNTEQRSKSIDQSGDRGNGGIGSSCGNDETAITEKNDRQ